MPRPEAARTNRVLKPMKTSYLIDMDGVLYRENQLIAGAMEFVDALVSTGTPFLFLTNNSAPTPEDLAVRLKHLGIGGLSPRNFYTSALNAADFPGRTPSGLPGLRHWRRGFAHGPPRT